MQGKKYSIYKKKKDVERSINEDEKFGVSIQLSGCIIDNKSGGIIFPSLPYAKKISISHLTEYDLSPNDSDEKLILSNYEGIYIKVFHASYSTSTVAVGRWFIAHNNRLNASPDIIAKLSKVWPNFSDDFNMYLNKNTSYMFIITYTEIILCLSFVNGLNKYVVRTITSHNTLIERTPVKVLAPIKGISSIEQLTDFVVNDTDCGVLYINFKDSKPISFIKITRSSDGGNNDLERLKIHYIALKKSGNINKSNKVLHDNQEVCSTLDKDYDEFFNNLLLYYRRRYEKKEFIRYPPAIHHILLTTFKEYNINKNLEWNIHYKLQSIHPRDILKMMKLKI